VVPTLLAAGIVAGAADGDTIVTVLDATATGLAVVEGGRRSFRGRVGRQGPGG
jgi:hypothetical protein